MKFILFVLLIFIASISFASPYLVCDPQAGVEYYMITEGNTVTQVSAQPDGSIKMDLVNVAVGQHSVTAAACNNIWGCSTAVPFVYERPALNTVVGIKLIKD